MCIAFSVFFGLLVLTDSGSSFDSLSIASFGHCEHFRFRSRAFSAHPAGLRSTHCVFLRILLLGVSFRSCWRRFLFIQSFCVSSCSIVRLAVFLVVSRSTLSCTPMLLLTTHSHIRHCHSHTLLYSFLGSLAHTFFAYLSKTSSCTTSSCCIPRRLPIIITVSCAFSTLKTDQQTHIDRHQFVVESCEQSICHFLLFSRTSHIVAVILHHHFLLYVHIFLFLAHCHRRISFFDFFCKGGFVVVVAKKCCLLVGLATTHVSFQTLLQRVVRLGC